MNTDNEQWKKKISDRLLCEFVASNHPDTVSVLVEVEAPEPTVEIDHAAYSQKRLVKSTAVIYSAEQEEAEKAAVKETQTLLESLGLANRFLRSSRVFVIDATPNQLRRIVEAQTVRAIIPNRKGKY